MSAKKYILFGLIIIFIIGAFFFTVSNHNTGEEDQLKQDDYLNKLPDSDEQLAGIILTFFNSQKTVCWELTALEANKFNEQGYWELAPVNIRALDTFALQLYSLAAEKAVYLTSSGDLKLRDSIVFNKGKLELKTESLSWQKGDNKIIGSRGVVLSSLDFFITGDNFTTEPDLNKIIIYGNQEKQAYFTWKERD